jgi:CRP-like cAMP-binding protein
MPDNYTLLSYAFWLGAISASSLLFGAILALFSNPNRMVIGFMAAFGGGALLAALTIELVAPAALGVTKATNQMERMLAEDFFIQLVIGMVSGGILFIFLDQLISKRGGYLRKYASSVGHLLALQGTRQKVIKEELSKLNLFKSIPEDSFDSLVTSISITDYAPEELLFNEGTTAQSLYIIQQGEVNILYGGQSAMTLRPGSVLGEVSILTGNPLRASAQAVRATKIIQIPKAIIDEMRAAYPVVEKELATLAEQLLQKMKQNSQRMLINEVSWTRSELSSLRSGNYRPDNSEFKKAATEYKVKPLTIWVGILLDGIPESFILGMSTFLSMTTHINTDGNISFLSIVPYTFVVGLFLSNFPEAFSSAINMRTIGYSSKRILLLWGSLVVLTALGALFGAAVGESVSHHTLALVEGLAAGAMLTMIAASMLPEAAHSGGSYTTGFATLLGFLSAILFKLLE